MIYAGDQAIAYPVKDIYDTQIMAMSIAAAKDMYEKGQQQIKDFYKEYGDFMSPIQKDMDWYSQNVTGKVRDTINNLYANGIDPLRSAEGRAAVSQLIYSMPTGDIAKLRQSAAAANEYIKNRGKLEAAGLYNPDAEQNYLGFNLDNYSTLRDGDQPGMGVWSRTSPIENKTMDEIIEPIIKNLDYSYDEARTKQANDGNDYYTVSEDRIRQTIADSMNDLTVKGTMGGYYYDQALKQTGYDPDAARALYTEWLVNRGKDHLKEKFTPNKWKEMAKEYQYKRRLENLRHTNAMIENGALNPQNNTDYDFASDMYDKMLNRIAGAPGGHQWTDANGNSVPAIKYFDKKGDLIEAQREFGKSFRGNNLNRIRGYLQKYTHTEGLSGALFAEYLQRPLFTKLVGNANNLTGKGLVRLDDGDLSKIKTIADMVSSTAGYIGQHKSGSKDEQKLIANMKANPYNYAIGGNNIDVYGAGMKYGRFENNFIVDVYDIEHGQKVGSVAYDSNINSTKTSKGFYMSNNNSEAATAKDLTTRQAVEAGSTAVNKKFYNTTRSQNMPLVSPYFGQTD